MNYRDINRIGFGTSPLGGITKLGHKHVGMGYQDVKKSISALEYAYSKGIKFFDTADVYGNGRVEKLIGSVFKEINDIQICTKFGNLVKDNEIKFDYSIKHLNQSLHSSLKKLNRDYIDIFLIHSPPSSMKLNNEYEKHIVKLIENKKILNFGISCNSINDAINFTNKYNFITYIQINFNLLDRRGLDFFKIAKKNKIKIISRAPFANGMIFKKNIVKNFTKSDFRIKYDKEFKDWLSIQIINLEKIKKNKKMISFALNFILYHKYIDHIIPGMRSKNQVIDVIKSLNDRPLTKTQINNIYKKIPVAYHGW